MVENAHGKTAAINLGVRLLLLAGMLIAGCGDGSAPRASQARARPALPSLRLIALTDLEGYLEPCGCQSRPLGGIDRAAQRLRQLNADGVPSVLIAAGDLFFGSVSSAHATTASDATVQEQWQAETLARALGSLQLAAAVPGAADLARGHSALRALAKLSGTTLLCSADGAEPTACQASTIVKRGGVQIGIWGLADPTRSAQSGSLTPLSDAAKRLTADLRARGATLVIGLLDADARAARRLAGATPGLDFLVHGGAAGGEVPPPERIGDTTLVRAGHQGQDLLVVDLFMDANQPAPFTDVSAWTRRAARNAQERRVTELASRIDEWRRDPNVDRPRLLEQEHRLLALQAAAKQEPVARQGGNTFSAQLIELDEKTPPDPALRALLVAHDRRVNEHNKVALAHVKPRPVPAGMPGYVGSERCGSCHAAALSWWTQHAHGRAYATLERVEKQFSLQCVSCHVTGYGEPGGATVVHNQGLTNVGCESCHGPGELHARDPDSEASKNVQRDVAASICRTCHDAEHSDRFEYASYKSRLLVPGHGKPARVAQ